MNEIEIFIGQDLIYRGCPDECEGPTIAWKLYARVDGALYEHLQSWTLQIDAQRAEQHARTSIHSFNDIDMAEWKVAL